MPSSRPIRHISPKQPFSEWSEQLYARRETLWFFIWKDLKVQYRKPIFGLAWSVFQPLVYFGVILMVMQVSGRSATETTLPFSLYLISGLAIWNFVTSVVLGSVNSVQSNAGIISKASFPRFYLVLSPVLKGLLDLSIMLLLTFGIALLLGQSIELDMVIFLPAAISLSVFTCLGWSAIAASIVVRIPQARHAIPIIMYAMLFTLPVFYDVSETSSETLSIIYRANPIAGAIDVFRIGFGAEPASISELTIWFGQSIIWMVIGVWSFRITERKLADLI
jgi:ABC-type polysaccharide/polyol phosphate export permease